jgi:hypothetical protein
MQYATGFERSPEKSNKQKMAIALRTPRDWASASLQGADYTYLPVELGDEGAQLERIPPFGSSS